MESLVERARRGERDALEELLAGVAPQIKRFGLLMCKNEHDADDVLQDTLISVANNLAGFEGRASLSSWVFALTRSACARRRRGLKNRPPAADDDRDERPDPAASPEAVASDREIGAAVTRALAGLSDEHREVIVLRDVEGLSAAEAATALGVSVDALKSRLHRAREALRVALRPLLEPAATPSAPGCPDVVLSWSQKLEGDLSQGDCAVMEAHIQSCPSCGAACDALKRALGACRRVATAEVPHDVQARVKAAIVAWAPDLRPRA
jgi:RNA polymerase sigma-70 factor (ECF subfamily)